MIWNKASLLSVDVFRFDVCVVASTWLAAYAIRFNGAAPVDFAHDALSALMWALPCAQ
jgi:hypothetical protein